MSEEVKNTDTPEEVVIGEKHSKEYRKTNFKESAEVKMLFYVIPVAIVLVIVGYILSR